MHSLLLLAALALAAPAPLDEPTPALQARVVRELEAPQAIADLFRLYERRDEKGDLAPLMATLQQAARSPKARADVRALAIQMRADLSLAQGQVRGKRNESAPMLP